MQAAVSNDLANVRNGSEAVISSRAHLAVDAIDGGDRAGGSFPADGPFGLARYPRAQ